MGARETEKIHREIKCKVITRVIEKYFYFKLSDLGFKSLNQRNMGQIVIRQLVYPFVITFEDYMFVDILKNAEYACHPRLTNLVKQWRTEKKAKDIEGDRDGREKHNLFCLLSHSPSKRQIYIKFS